MFITFDPFIQYSQTRYHWIPWAKPYSTAWTNVVILRHDGFSAILVYVKNLQNATTNLVQSSQNLVHRPMTYHQGDTQWIWWPLTSRGAIINKEVFLLLSRHMSIFRTNFLCLLILSNRPILLTKYFPLEHQKLAAMLKVVKINITYPQATEYVQSSLNLPYMIFRPSQTNLPNSFF